MQSMHGVKDHDPSYTGEFSEITNYMMSKDHSFPPVVAENRELRDGRALRARRAVGPRREAGEAGSAADAL